MTEDQKYEIAVLAEDYENKRLRWENLGYLNVNGKTAEQRIQMSIDYQIAETEMRQAESRLHVAKHTIAKS